MNVAPSTSPTNVLRKLISVQFSVLQLRCKLCGAYRGSLLRCNDMHPVFLILHRQYINAM